MHIDENYNDLLKKILKEGYDYEDPNREGVIRKELASYTFKHSFSDGFPAITLKKLAWKSVVTECLWFLRGDTNIKYLIDNGCNIWNKDAYSYYLKISKQVDDSILSFEDFLKNIGNYPKYSIMYKYGDLGKVYGFYWTNWGGRNNNYKIQNPPELDKKYTPTYLGIACGKGKEGHFLAKTWEGLISRCYDKNNISYPYYGAKGVSVCNKWLSFEGFLEDIQKLPNYKYKELSPKKYFLDKDGLGCGFIYNLDSCQWVTHSENSILKTNVEYVVEKNNIQYKFKNISEFCKEHGIDNRNFSDLWTKSAKSRYGFKLISVIDKNNGIDQIKELIHDMINKPMSSELLVVARDPSHKEEQALPCCHYNWQIVMKPLSLTQRYKMLKESLLFEQFLKEQHIRIANKTSENFKSEFLDQYFPKYGFELHFKMRSVDTFLGLPFNIASYALLALILEKITGHKALGIQGDLKKVHLYDNSIEAAKELITRKCSEEKVRMHFAGEEVDQLIDKVVSGERTLDQWLSKVTPRNFKLIDYNPQPAIRVAMLARTV